MWALAALGAGGLLSAGGAYSSAKTQKMQAKHMANMANINAGLARQQAEGAFIQGRSQIASAMRQQGQAIARERASLASRGIDIGYGSAAESRATSEFYKEVDYNTMSANALRSAWGYRQQATDYENQALMKRAEAKSIDPGQAAFNSLLSSAATSALSFKALGGNFSDLFGSGAAATATEAAQGANLGTGSIGFKASPDSLMKIPEFSVPMSAQYAMMMF